MIYGRVVSEFRYPQFCPLARAAEVLGERWTLLILRELMLRPVRFSELRRRLYRVSPSVLSARIGALEEKGIVVRRELPPPACVTVIELTPLGKSLEPVLGALTRFGFQIIGPPEPDDHFEPSWLRLGIPATVGGHPTPEARVALTIRDPEGDFTVEIEGGPQGATTRDVEPGEALDADLVVRGEGMLVMGVATGAIDPQAAVDSGDLEVEGDAGLLARLPDFFAFGGDADASAH